jgi:hypothetical protein
MDTNKHIISFAGNPIFYSQKNPMASNKELDFLRKIKFRNNDFKIRPRFSKESHILKYKQLKNIKKILLDNFNYYLNKVLEINNSFYICNSWATIQKKGNFHNGHHHPNHIFSAVYYAKAEKSSLIFQIERSKIQEGFLFQYNVKNYNYFNSSSWTLEVNSGDVLIFPGHLQHSSSICETDERIVVGSSFFIKEKIGLEGDYNDIYLKGE